MNEADFRQILARGQEGRHVEFKKSVSWDRGDFKWKIVKTVLAFSNVRDGGAIIIGVEETADGFRFTGITDEHRATYDEDDIREKVATRADPYATCRLEDHTDEAGNQYAVIDVDQFDELPVICKRDGPCNLFEGAIYTRSYRMPESVPVPSQTEMRRILDMAVEEQLRRHYQRQERVGAGQDRLTAAEKFAAEMDDVDV